MKGIFLSESSNAARNLQNACKFARGHRQPLPPLVHSSQLTEEDQIFVVARRRLVLGTDRDRADRAAFLDAFHVVALVSLAAALGAAQED